MFDIQNTGIGPNPNFIGTFRPADRDIFGHLSTARISVFDKAVAGPSTQDYVELTLFNAGAGNDLLALTYASMGTLVYSHGLGSYSQVDFRPFAYFAQLTSASNVPSTGTATYSGVVMGTANPTTPAYNSGFAYDLSGTVRITVDFATRTYTGSVTLIGTDTQQPLVVVNLGTFPITQGAVPASIAMLSGTINGGDFAAMLAGPAAEEVAGTFIMTAPDARPNGAVLTLAVAFAAKQ
jgi:hypothetical protein